MTNSTRFAIVVALGLFSTFSAHANASKASEYFHAVHCVAKGEKCTPFFAKRTKYACKAGIPMSKQGKWCIKLACKWCAKDKKKRYSYPCTYRPLRARCIKMQKEESKNKEAKKKMPKDDADVPTTASSRYFHAAHCVAKGKKCTPFFARRTKYACKPETPISKQSKWCITLACKWCALDKKKRYSYPCTYRPLASRCPKPEKKERRKMKESRKPENKKDAPESSTASSRYFHAVHCVAKGKECTPFFAKKTKYACKPRRTIWKQSKWCIKLACKWCAKDKKKRYSYPCTYRPLAKRCKKLEKKENVKYGKKEKPNKPDKPMKPKTPTNKPKRPSQPAPPTRTAQPSTTKAPAPAPKKPETSDGAKPSPSPQAPEDKGGRLPERRAGECTWEGNDSVVIDLGAVVPGEGWERSYRDGFKGMIFRSKWTHGLAHPHQGGTMCFPVRVSEAGDYFLTFVSYAQHKTEHNDAWIASKDLPLKLWKTNGARSFGASAGEFFKAYHSNGDKGGMSIEMKTGDNDGHRFVILGVKAGVPFRVCLSGRSFKFEVYRLVLKKCYSDLCEGRGLWRKFIYGLPVSQCI